MIAPGRVANLRDLLPSEAARKRLVPMEYAILCPSGDHAELLARRPPRACGEPEGKGTRHTLAVPNSGSVALDWSPRFIARNSEPLGEISSKSICGKALSTGKISPPRGDTYRIMRSFPSQVRK